MQRYDARCRGCGRSIRVREYPQGPITEASRPGSGPGPEVTGSSGCSGLPGRGRVPARGRPGAAAQTRPGWSRETHYRFPAIMLTPFREPARPGRTRTPGTVLDAESEDSQAEQTRTAQETALDAA